MYTYLFTIFCLPKFIHFNVARLSRAERPFEKFTKYYLPFVYHYIVPRYFYYFFLLGHFRVNRRINGFFFIQFQICLFRLCRELLSEKSWFFISFGLHPREAILYNLWSGKKKKKTIIIFRFKLYNNGIDRTKYYVYLPTYLTALRHCSGDRSVRNLSWGYDDTWFGGRFSVTTCRKPKYNRVCWCRKFARTGKVKNKRRTMKKKIKRETYPIPIEMGTLKTITMRKRNRFIYFDFFFANKTYSDQFCWCLIHRLCRW